jgi:L-ascorbate metabolism protein UlaG (beta-lactamase superfamily)
MKLKWNGHASFTLSSDSGLCIITDPYEPGGFGGAIAHAAIPDRADIVLVSHEHGDHNFVKQLQGSPLVVRGSQELKGVKIKAVPVFHDTSQGKERGKNNLFAFELDGIRVAFLGDLGHILTPEQIQELEKPDLVLMPVGGYFTIDAEQAHKLTGLLKPSIVIPMHYKTDKVQLPIKPAEPFLKLFAKVKKLDAAEVLLKKSELPKSTEVWVLKYAC